jgi:hypothetical protein
MLTIVKNALRIANREIGYTEWPPKSNRTKYGIEFGDDGKQWCCIFAWWVWFHAGYKDFPHTNYSGAVWKWAIKRKLTRVVPRVGDIPVYRFPGGDEFDHIGAVITAIKSNGYFTAIEGNTSLYGSQSNGGAVLSKLRHRSDCWGFIRLDDDQEDVPVTNAEMVKIVEMVWNRFTITTPDGREIHVQQAFEEILRQVTR